MSTLTGWFFISYGTVWVIIFSLLTVIGIILSIAVDWQWAIVTLMLLCLVIPMATVFLYYFHALKAATCLNTPLHTLRLDPDGLTITLFIPKEKKKNTDEDKTESDKADDRFEEEKMDNDRKVDDKIEYEVVRDVRFPYHEFSRKSITSSAAVYSLTRIKDNDLGVIFVPINAFDNEGLFISFINQLDAMIKSLSHK